MAATFHEIEARALNLVKQERIRLIETLLQTIDDAERAEIKARLESTLSS